MSYIIEADPLLKFHQICYGRSVVIRGPAVGEGCNIAPALSFFDSISSVEFTLNSVFPLYASAYSVWLDNGSPQKLSSLDDAFTLRAAHLGIRNPNELLFLSGPMSEDQLTFAPPHLFADNAWHKSIWFSPLAGVVALEKVRHTGARKIYMLGMDLYQGNQSLAYAHNLVDNARYISEIARDDSRVVLCEALENSIRGILL